MMVDIVIEARKAKIFSGCEVKRIQLLENY